MGHTYLKCLVLLPGLILGVPGVAGSAQPSTVGPVSHVEAPAAEALRLAQRGQMSLGEAVNLVRSRTGGKILAANTVRRDGQVYYRIKVLLREGVVRVVFVDAASGSMR